MTTPEDDQAAQRPPTHPDPPQLHAGNLLHAANLPVVSESSASPEVQRLYQQFRDDFGRPHVPGILQCFATHPPLLAAMLNVAKTMLFVEGALTRQHKEMISAFVSASNRCDYCADSHAYSFLTQGGSAAALDAVLACDPESLAIAPKERILLRFVEKVTANSADIAPDDIAALRAAGWTDLQIAETIHVTALFAAFNRTVSAFGLPSQELLKLFAQQHEETSAHA